MEYQTDIPTVYQFYGDVKDDDRVVIITPKKEDERPQDPRKHEGPDLEIIIHEETPKEEPEVPPFILPKIPKKPKKKNLPN